VNASIAPRHHVILRLSKDGREITLTGMPILREPQDDMVAPQDDMVAPQDGMVAARDDGDGTRDTVAARYDMVAA